MLRFGFGQVKRFPERRPPLDRLLLVGLIVQGLITERHMQTAERCFPGIKRFYLQLVQKPSTFLELVWEYEKHLDRQSCTAQDTRRRASGRLIR
jgi:hypothetical protein